MRSVRVLAEEHDIRESPTACSVSIEAAINHAGRKEFDRLRHGLPPKEMGSIRSGPR